MNQAVNLPAGFSQLDGRQAGAVLRARAVDDEPGRIGVWVWPHQVGQFSDQMFEPHPMGSFLSVQEIHQIHPGNARGSEIQGNLREGHHIVGDESS